MKTALAIVCSLILAWANVVLAQTPGAGEAGAARSCCHCGKKTGCCAADHSLPESQPVSAAPASSFRNQFSPFDAAVVAWTLPDAVTHELSSPVFPSLTARGSALFARNCARLI
jgi:hypothetical protein